MGDPNSAKPDAAKTEVPLTLVLSRTNQLLGHKPDDLWADDLTWGHRHAMIKTVQCGLIVLPLYYNLESILIATMSAGVLGMVQGGHKQIPASDEVLAEPKKLLWRFTVTGGSGDWVWKPDSAVSLYARDLPNVSTFVLNNFKLPFQDAVDTAWKSKERRVDDAAIAAKLKQASKLDELVPPFIGGALSGFIGGSQGYRVEVCDFTADAAAKAFTFRIAAEFYDHFGVDHTDVDGRGINIPAEVTLAHWFMLQHFRSLDADGKKFVPSRTVLKVSYGPFTHHVGT